MHSGLSTSELAHSTLVATGYWNSQSSGKHLPWSLLAIPNCWLAVELGNSSSVIPTASGPVSFVWFLGLPAAVSGHTEVAAALFNGEVFPLSCQPRVLARVQIWHTLGSAIIASLFSTPTRAAALLASKTVSLGPSCCWALWRWRRRNWWEPLGRAVLGL